MVEMVNQGIPKAGKQLGRALSGPLEELLKAKSTMALKARKSWESTKTEAAPKEETPQGGYLREWRPQDLRLPARRLTVPRKAVRLRAQKPVRERVTVQEERLKVDQPMAGRPKEEI